MPDNTTNSIVSIGNLTKPADTLIKKISKMVTGAFAPYHIVRLAKAEAEATIIKAQADIQITDLHRRAMSRFIEEEAQRQKNIEDITNKALLELKEGADPNAIEDDWITNFFDKSRIVSDSEMQILWSRILAGEANVPKTFSKRTVNFLSDLDKVDAELFSKLCGFGWMMGDIIPLVFNAQADIYNKQGIDFNTLIHLESIGLIQFNYNSGFRSLKLPKQVAALYFGKPLILEMPQDSENELGIGQVLLTKIGLELARICQSNPIDGFWDYVNDQWKNYLPKPV
jgi:hypothetical protein